MRCVFIILFIFIFSFSCTKKELAPEAVLESYIQLHFDSANPSKEEVLGKLSGDLYSSLAELSDSEWEEMKRSQKLKDKSFTIINQNCTETRCSITYIVKYSAKSDDDNAILKSEVKKVAELEKEESGWKIYSVDNIKTYHESALPIQSN